MRKLFILLVVLLLPMVAMADEVEIDGIYYKLVSKLKIAEVIREPNYPYNYRSTVIYIPSKVIYNDKEYSVTSIGGYAFSGCTSLSSITIPNSVTSIGVSAFSGCTSLSSIAIPNSVTSIDGPAFSGCTSLSSITIPNSVTSIGMSAFFGCTSLSSITISNSVTSIGWGAFYGCTNLSSIAIPNSVISIGGYAFSGCTSLSSITIPNSVTSIEDNVFQGCTALNTIVVESGNLTYDSRNNCNAIIETASNALITGCKKTFIPNSVTSIGWGAFYGCTNLSSISIPNSVTSIGWGAFYVCTGLTEVTIGSDIEKIDEYSFCNCKDLLNIYCYSKNVPTTASNAFLDSDQEYITLHVPATSINAYKNTEPWCYFRDIVALTDDDPKPTGIGEVRSQKKEANKEIYDLQGRKVQNPRNGLYIIDGKKAVIK